MLVKNKLLISATRMAIFKNSCVRRFRFVHNLFFEMTANWQLQNLCLLISGLWMLHKGNQLCAINTWNHLNVLGAWSSVVTKMSQVNSVSFWWKRVKSCLAWVNCILWSLPLHPCLWIWLLTMREQSCKLEERSWIGLYIVFETTSFLLFFVLFFIQYNNKFH